MYKGNKERRIEVLKALTEPSNFRPRLTEISCKTGVPTSTVHDIYERYKEQIELSIRFITEIQLYSKTNRAISSHRQ